MVLLDGNLLPCINRTEREQLNKTFIPAEPDLPPHLKKYGLRKRLTTSFSGPSTFIPAENDEGDIEYKLRLSDSLGPTRFQQLVTQLNFRLSQGQGSCQYYIGVEDNGHPAGLSQTDLDQSIDVLRRLAAEVEASIQPLYTIKGTAAPDYQCAVIKVTRNPAPNGSTITVTSDLRIAVAGAVDAGKSTLVAVLTTGDAGQPLLDNGRGAARMNVLRHKHEIESGRTSSISHQFLGYAADDDSNDIEDQDRAATATTTTTTTTTTGSASVININRHRPFHNNNNSKNNSNSSSMQMEGSICALDSGDLSLPFSSSSFASSASSPNMVTTTTTTTATTTNINNSSSKKRGGVFPLNYSLSEMVDADINPAGGIASEATQLLRFFDLGGHERYLKMALFGMTGLLPDHVMLCVSATAGMFASRVTIQHLAIALAAGVPPFVVITKADLASSSSSHIKTCDDDDDVNNYNNEVIPRIESLVADIRRLAICAFTDSDSNGEEGGGGENGERIPVVSSIPQAEQLALQMQQHRMKKNGNENTFDDDSQQSSSSSSSSSSSTKLPHIPIFVISSVTGQGLDILHSFLRQLKPQGFPRLPLTIPDYDNATNTSKTKSANTVATTHFQVDDCFDVFDVGPVISGTLLSGRMQVGDVLKLGPNEGGEFIMVKIKGLQRAQVDVPSVLPGQHATVAIQEEEEKEEEEEEGGTADLIAGLQTATRRGSGSIDENSADLMRVQPTDGVLSRLSPLSHHNHNHHHHHLPQSQISVAKIRKGSVLLDPVGYPHPQAVVEFSAVLVAFNSSSSSNNNNNATNECGGSNGGRFRLATETGNITGTGTASSPPPPPPAAAATAAAAAAAAMLVPRHHHSLVVHCGSIRQSATVIETKPYSRAINIDSNSNSDVIIEEAMRAQYILNHPYNNNNNNNNNNNRWWCEKSLVEVRFALHRPCFMLCGSRVLIHDRSAGRLAAAGYVL
jgi:GTPase